MTNIPVFKVAVSGPFKNALDYIASKNLGPLSSYLGCRVQIELGRSKRIGVIVGISQESDLEYTKLKKIESMIDIKPKLSDLNLKLLFWFHKYYHSNIYETLNLGLPKNFVNGNDYSERAEEIFIVTDLFKKLTLEQLPKSAIKQRELYSFFEIESGVLSKSKTIQYGIPRSTLQSFQKKGYIHRTFKKITLENNKNIKLFSFQHNDCQKRAIDAVVKNLCIFGVYLLNGVTGSGKTEVYIQIVDKVLKSGKQALILVPEIGLTPQTVKRFKERFNEPVLYIHSKITDNVKYRNWEYSRNGNASIIIATRSGVFTQTKDLGVIIVDEEHDASYKQQSGIRYHARDVAVVRAKIENIPIILGSATPSLESLNNVDNGNYKPLILKNRAGESQKNKHHIIDMNKTVIQSGLSRPLLDKMREHLDKRGQILIFINRRGYAPILRCHDCGWVKECARCEKSYTYYNDPQQLCCHSCGSIKPVIVNCENCKSDNVSPIGVGTEQVEEFLNEYFPLSRVLRIDKSTTSSEKKLISTLKKVHSKKVDIIIGTQMVAKGHHFPGVSMVGIMNIDGSLYSSDYRAIEKVSQLIVQVAGRAGRENINGEVYLQTYQPNNYFLKLLFSRDYAELGKELLLERRSGQWPPYTYSFVLRAETTVLDDAVSILDKIIQELKKSQNYVHINCYGPLPCLVAKKSGKYRQMAIFKSEKRSGLHNIISIVELELIGRYSKKARISIDIDPQEMS